MLNTTQFNMPLKPDGPGLGRLTKAIDKVKIQSQKRNADTAAAIGARDVETSNELWASSKGYTEQKRNELGFDTYSQLKKWHESQDTNTARAAQRAVIRKSNPTVKSAATNAKRRQAAAAKRTAKSNSISATTPTWNPLKNVKPKPPTPMAPKPIPKPKVSRTKAAK